MAAEKRRQEPGQLFGAASEEFVADERGEGSANRKLAA